MSHIAYKQTYKSLHGMLVPVC